MTGVEAQMERPTWDALFAAIVGFNVEPQGTQELNHGNWMKGDVHVSLTAADPTRPDFVWITMSRPGSFVVKMDGSGPEFVRLARLALSATLA